MAEANRKNFTCIAPGCSKPARGLQLCEAHYQRLRNSGAVENARLDAPYIIYDGEVAYLPLPDGRRAIIDASDGPLFEGRRVYLNVAAYPALTVGTKKVLAHRHILQPPDGVEIDHINRDPLDNRRANLRLATHQQNMQNRKKNRPATTSRFKGVFRHATSDGWCAGVGEKKYLGFFATEEEAARAYDVAAIEAYGEFAATNADLGLL